MSEIPDILNTPIVPPATDAFWQDANGALNDYTPRPALFISAPIEAGSAAMTSLENMIKACKLQPDDYNLIFLPAGEPLAWHLMQQKLQPKYVVILGIDLSQLALSVVLMPHQVSRFSQCSFIPTASIHELNQYPDIKKHFWEYGLKPVFVDKVYG